MTKSEIDILNYSIKKIKDVCKSCNTCIECPMNHNCNEQPAHWKEVPYDNN